MPTLTIPERPQRHFLPKELTIDSWDKLVSFFEDLQQRELGSAEDIEAWLKDRSESDAVLEEDMAWRYIKMNIDTTDPDLQEKFNFFVQEISPKIAPIENELDKQLVSSEHLNGLDAEKYRIYLRSVKKSIELFREKNIPLLTKLQTESQKYGAITGQMTVEVDGEEVTMPKAASYLKDTDRAKREEVFVKMMERRGQDVDKLHTLFDELAELRQQVAKNADFENFRDYKFEAMGRFDYTVQDCYNFHDSIQSEIVPIIKGFNEERKQVLGLETLRPWDTEVDPTGKPPLKPFDGGKELVEKSIECFTRIRPFFGECLSIMNELGYLDLESKKGKAPGGFNYPLYEIGVPFIYMNAVGTLNDVITMVHEGGHAVHSFLTRDLELTAFKSFPSEVAELASMSMELISMEHWDVFFSDEDELKRAKKYQLEKALSVLPWVAIVDKFQHWLYENAGHTVEQRTEEWTEIQDQFSSGVVDWRGHEDSRKVAWQRQLHIYEVPFYYIEYGMAQLGAIAVWRNYKNNSENALDQYMDGLKLGYTKSIGEIYEAAGIRFDFSGPYVKELADFVKAELAAL